MFKRGNVYYATFGSCCCYCQSGSPVSVYTATSPLGPYTKRNVLGSSPRLGAVEPPVPAPSPALAISRQDSLQAKPTAVDVTPSNPFCGFNHQENTFYLSLFCVNGVIDSLPFVSYGTPTGSCPGPFVRSSCDSASFISYATATCVGQPNCTLTAPITPDPCLGTVRFAHVSLLLLQLKIALFLLSAGQVDRCHRTLFRRPWWLCNHPPSAAPASAPAWRLWLAADGCICVRRCCGRAAVHVHR
jgi:hypothetical protein